MHQMQALAVEEELLQQVALESNQTQTVLVGMVVQDRQAHLMRLVMAQAVCLPEEVVAERKQHHLQPVVEGLVVVELVLILMRQQERQAVLILVAVEVAVDMFPALVTAVLADQVSSSSRSINKRSHEEDHEVLRH